jgi:transcriptional regulator with XRE-family HTH domain
MTDRLEVLRRVAGELTQSEIARRLDVSPSTISQILSGTYRASDEHILTRVAELWGDETVECPVLGEIPLGQCSDERSRTEFRATGPLRVRLWETCPGCTAPTGGAA